MEKFGSHWTDFQEIWYFSIFRKSVEKSQGSLKSYKKVGTLHEDLCTFMITSRLILVGMTNVSDISGRRNHNTHFMFTNFIFFFRKSFRLWGNAEKYGTARQVTDGNIKRRMRFACSMTTATHTEYLILIAYPRWQCLRERTPVLRYTYIACLAVFDIVRPRNFSF